MAATSASASSSPGPATAHWQALGTSVVLQVTDAAELARAQSIVASQLDELDLACSRFRADSELSRVNARAGHGPIRISSLLAQALQAALHAARCSDGDVDPTIGAALVLAGYDRDFSLLEPAPYDAGAGPVLAPVRPLRAELRRGWCAIELDPVRGTVRVPRGIALDLGASAKAWAADRAAGSVHERCGAGVLVGIGGDIATAGRAPHGGWRIHVTDDHRDGPQAPGQTIAISDGGLATSSIAVRRWRRGGRVAHHIIDPADGAPVRGTWRTVSVAAADCLDANIASTAALVRGARAPGWLSDLGLPARLVDRAGRVLHVGDWPYGEDEQLHADASHREPQAAA
ncbi:MAG TPA: FAD:protein FMN transferase [Solirubrobacteraceae bacterium]|nr:FAD:protein FMN transferase [Solirubrobacteraceae bacterium]